MNGVMVTDNQRVQAEALAAELIRRGFGVKLHKTGGHQLHPCIQVDSGIGRAVRWREFIYTAPDDDGVWRFWWSWLDPISAISEVDIAASSILFVLGLPVAA